MQQRQDDAFDIEEARRVLGDVFCALGAGPPPVDRGNRSRAARRRPDRLATRRDSASAVLRTALPQRRRRLRSGAYGICRYCHGDRKPRGESRLSTDDNRRPDDAFHARGCFIRRAGRCTNRPSRTHHEFRPGHPFVGWRQQARGDGFERICDAVSAQRHHRKQKLAEWRASNWSKFISPQSAWC